MPYTSFPPLLERGALLSFVGDIFLGLWSWGQTLVKLLSETRYAWGLGSKNTQLFQELFSLPRWFGTALKGKIRRDSATNLIPDIYFKYRPRSRFRFIEFITFDGWGL